MKTRHLCSSCRLAMCFKCGMSTDLFRASRKNKSNRKNLIKLQVQQASNILPSDQSLLTNDQWTLLSNLFYCYQESQLLSNGQRLIDTHNDLQSSYVIYQALVEQFLASIYETAGIYLRSNDDLRGLPSDPRSMILRSAADNVTCIGAGFAMQHCYLYGLDAFLNALELKYGKRTVDIHLWASRFIDPDIVLIKLAISLFAFSENTCFNSSNILNDLINPINILEIQNKYAEVTWKYLLHRYGHYHAVQRFLNLILWLSSINILTIHAQTLIPHLNDIDSLVEQTELTLILDDVDQIIETH